MAEKVLGQVVLGGTAPPRPSQIVCIDSGKVCNADRMGESRQPSRWPIALLVAVVNGIAGGLLCLPVAFWGMKIHHASHFEGSSDFGVAFIWMPLAAIIGFVVGFAISFSTRRRGVAGYIYRQAIALLAIAGLIAAGGGIAYATAKHLRAPLIDGKQLVLQIELRVPTNGRTIEQLQATGFNARLDADPDEMPDSSPLFSRAVRTDEFITVPMWAPLNSETAPREIAAWDAHESWHTFKVAVPASPQKVDEQWSDWVVSLSPGTENKQRQVEECHARYRVRFASENPVLSLSP